MKHYADVLYYDSKGDAPFRGACSCGWGAPNNHAKMEDALAEAEQHVVDSIAEDE